MRSEAAVEGSGGEAGPRESELQGGDVPAEGSAREQPATEQVATVAAEGAPRSRADNSVRREAVATLEPDHARRSRRALDPVDRPGVQPSGPQRDLKSGDTALRSKRRRRRREHSRSGEHEDAPDPAEPVGGLPV